MTDIPDDIRERGIPDDIHVTSLVRARDFVSSGYAYIVISSALLAERIATEARVREQCAKIAEADAANRSEMEGYGTAKASGHRIAAAIRETAR